MNKKQLIESKIKSIVREEVKKLIDEGVASTLQSDYLNMLDDLGLGMSVLLNLYDSGKIDKSKYTTIEKLHNKVMSDIWKYSVAINKIPFINK